MAIEVVDVAPFADAATERQRTLFARAEAAGLVLPRLVGITDNAGAADIASYSRALDGQAAKINPAHERDSTHEAATYRLYKATDMRDARQEAERIAGAAGVGILPFRRFRDEANARLVLGVIPPEQDVDAQASGLVHKAATAMTGLRIAQHVLLERGETLRGKIIGILGAGAAFGGPLEQILAGLPEEERPDDVTIMTERRNTNMITSAGRFDVLFLGARDPKDATRTAEMITPAHIRRGSNDRRDSMLLIDAAYGLAGDGTPRGNLHRDFFDPNARFEDMNAVATPFGAVGRMTRFQMFDSAFAVAAIQTQALTEIPR
jgi:5,10-methylene-tetrahydrofolate dehydrogenase/methenyl tetrahydrofolate cyclohydrolase